MPNKPKKILKIKKLKERVYVTDELLTDHCLTGNCDDVRFILGSLDTRLWKLLRRSMPKKRIQGINFN
jgi:hypothetical protein